MSAVGEVIINKFTRENKNSSTSVTFFPKAKYTYINKKHEFSENLC